MSAKICLWCRELKEIKGRAVVCDDCLMDLYKSAKKKEPVDKPSGSKVVSTLV